MNTTCGKCVLIIALLIAFGAASCMASVIYVKPESKPPRATHNGASWNTAYASINDAVARAKSDSEIWVAQGSYSGLVLLPVGAKLYGGFTGTETSRDQRNSAQHETLLLISGLYIINDTKGQCVVDGFTIDTNGNTGVYLIGANSLIANNNITDCSYGILCLNGAPVISANKLTDNTYGIICTGTAAKVYNNLISDCTTAGIDCRTRDASMIVNNTVVSAGQGVGIYVHDGSATLANNIVAYWPQAGVRISKGVKALLSHNCVYGNGTNYDGVKADSGSISTDPEFVDKTYCDLTGGSPCIDAGDDAYVQSGELDINGNLRLCGLHVDIGADESSILPPTTPVVIDDGANQLSTDSLHAVWSSTGRPSAVVEYDYAIGTSATYTTGTPLIVGWTSVGTHTGVTVMNLRLRDDPGLRYYFYVKAKDAAGQWSSVGVSGGVYVTDLQDKDYLLGIGDFEESHLIRWWCNPPYSDLATPGSCPSEYVQPGGYSGYLVPGSTDKEVGDGWMMLVGYTSNPYANTIYKLDRTNRFGTMNCQYIALNGNESHYWSVGLGKAFWTDTGKNYDLRAGDKVVLTIDHLQMSDYTGANVAYHVSVGSTDIVLTPSTKPFSYSTPVHTVPTGGRMDITIYLDTNGSLNGHTPGLYIDGVHLTVQRVGDSGNERWALPVRPARNIKTQNFGFTDHVIDTYSALRDYDILAEEDAEWSYMSTLRKLNPSVQINLYESAETCLDVRDENGADPPFRTSPASFWELTNPDSPLRHPEWLFSDGKDGFLSMTVYPKRFPVHGEYGDYQRFWSSTIVNKASGIYDGIFIDDVGVDAEGTPEERWAHAQEFVHAVYPDLKTAGLNVIQNAASRHVDGSGDWDGGDGRIFFDPFWVTTTRFSPTIGYSNNTPKNTADTFFQEYGFFETNTTENIFNRDYWLHCLADMDKIKGWNTAVGRNWQPLLGDNEKRSICMSIDANDLPGQPIFGPDGWVNFALCSYLCGQNDWTSLGIVLRTSVHVMYPNIDYSVTKRLGAPDGVRKQFSTSDPYWQYRDYKSSGPGEAGGVVVVNGDTAAARTYTVPFDADMAELQDGLTLFTFVPANTVIEVPVNSGRILIRR